MSRLILTAALLTLLFPAAALAHGVDITYQAKNAIEIVAKYDTGEPVREGQVVIFAPDNPATPWNTGKADAEGRYTFAPDPAKPGNWSIQVRQAGHGGMVHIPLGGEAAAASAAGSYTRAQIALMGASAAWGFIGTALYFSRRKS